MKIFVLALLTATSITAFAQTCPVASLELEALERLKATRVGRATREQLDSWIMDQEKVLARAFATCKENGREVSVAERAAERKRVEGLVAQEAANEAAKDAWRAAEPERAEQMVAEDVADKVGRGAAFRAKLQTENPLFWKTDPGSLADVASEISYTTTAQMRLASGAVQVTQLASQLQIRYSQLLMRQNDEIIRLLRIIAMEKK